MRYRSQYQKRKRLTQDDNLYASESFLLPKKTLEIIRNLAKEKGVSRSRLVGIALDNELDTQEPFTYDVTLPKDYKSDEYPDEMNRIYKFFSVKSMTPQLESMVLARRDMNIPNKKVLLACLSEMLDRGIIKYTTDFRGRKVLKVTTVDDIEHDDVEVEF